VTLCGALEADENAAYRMHRGNDVSVTAVRVVPSADDAVTITAATGHEKRTVTADGTLSARSLVFHNPPAGTSYQAIRAGNKITVKGQLRHRSLQRTFTVGNAPWWQAIEQALERFARTKAGFMKFRFINADECELHEMEATREGVETVTVDGRAVRAVRVKVNLPGLASLFWRADYWFRERDGTFVRYETVAGPGGQRITMELISKQDQNHKEGTHDGSR
jgi:hypothetical protein